MTLGNYTIKNCKCCKLCIFLKIITHCINKLFKMLISRDNNNYENRQVTLFRVTHNANISY